MTNRSQFPVFDANNAAHAPYILDGIKYNYNTSTGHWETEIGKNVTIVTKDTDATYKVTPTVDQFVAHLANEQLLTVTQVDSNFINLKQGILDLERETNYFHDALQDGINNEASTRLAEDTRIEGILTNSSTGLGSKISTSGGTFTGAVFGPTGAVNSVSAQLVNEQFLNREFGQFNTSLIPKVNSTQTIGSSTKQFSGVHTESIFVDTSIEPRVAKAPDITLNELRFNSTTGQNDLIQYKDVNIGSTTNRFNKLFIRDIDAAGDTLTLGTSALKGKSGGGLLIPANSAVGTADNEIPSNFANTLLDERFANYLFNSDILSSSFTAGGAIASGKPVKINFEGTVTQITSSVNSTGFIGFATNTVADGGTVFVTVSGRISGQTNLTTDSLVYLGDDGTLSHTKTDTNKKIGVAVSTTTLFLFSTAPTSEYILAKTKLGFDDLSAVTGTPTGDGSLEYSSLTGRFTFTPPNLSPYATQTYVTTQINNLISGAPDALNTLDELASALNDNANFAAGVTTAIGLKAPLASPTFTGTPTVPAPDSSSNSNQVATTAFVKSQSGSSSLSGLTDVTISSNLQDGQVIAYDAVAGIFKNRVGTGSGSGSSNITFIVDGGTATTAASSVDIFLDGGAA
tara:strand:- start:1046 stop:2932 length:1887 start_codon:yes stop_codon:yes gene_type:complete